MEIGAYLFTSGLVWLLGLIFVRRLRQRLAAYSALGCILPTIALALYLLFPIWAGIYGTATVQPDPVSWRTYIERGGAIGVALLLLYVIGILWPIVAARIINRYKIQQF